MKRLIVLSLTLIPVLTQAQERHPIDQMSYEALQQAITTADMVDAQQLAYDGWEQLLNLTLAALRQIMEPSTWAALNTSQKQWEAFRDKEFEVVDRIYYVELQGTMWRPVSVSARKQVVKQRAETLMAQYDLLAAQSEKNMDVLVGTWRPSDATDQPTLVVNDNFTALWKGLRPEESKLEFYSISNDCNGRIYPDERRILTFYKFGFPSESRCYFIDMPDNDHLRLSAIKGGELWLLNRGR